MYNPYQIPVPPVYQGSELLKNLNLCVVDVETTGINPLDDRIVSIACRKIENGKVLKPFYTLVDPEMVIPPVASATHGITNYFLAQSNAPKLDAIIDQVVDYIGDSQIVAHNAAFDRAFVNPPFFFENGYTRTKWVETPDDLQWKAQFNAKGREWLCTYRLAHHLYKAHYGYTDISLKNESLRFWLEPQYVPSEKAHNALVDVNTTIHLLMHELSYAEKYLNIQSLKELFALQNQALALQEMPIGKHRGENLRDVPNSYLEWCLNNPDKMGGGLTYELGLTLTNELERRKANNIFVGDSFAGSSTIKGNLFQQKAKPDVMANVSVNKGQLAPLAHHTEKYEKMSSCEAKKV